MESYTAAATHLDLHAVVSLHVRPVPGHVCGGCGWVERGDLDPELFESLQVARMLLSQQWPAAGLQAHSPHLHAITSLPQHMSFAYQHSSQQATRWTELIAGLQQGSAAPMQDLIGRTSCKLRDQPRMPHLEAQ